MKQIRSERYIINNYKVLICVILVVVANNRTNVKAAATATATTTLTKTQYDKEFLEEHNKARIRAGMAPFTYDERLAEFARKHALSHARDCALRHSDGPYGENLFWGNAAKSLKWAPKDAVYAWMKEERYYNKKTNTCMAGQKCGHYTQIMWRDTKKVGCALCNCNGKSTYMVCEYDPPGNFEGLSPFDKHDPFIYTSTQTN